MEAVIAWILAFMVVAAPPGRKTFYPEAQETQIEAEARYRSIAEDVVSVVYDPDTKPLFGGKFGRSRTATVVLSVMLWESGFMKNVDQGVGKFARGDNGRSWCLMQLNVGTGKTPSWNQTHNRMVRAKDKPEDIVEGFTGPEMVADRKKCIIAGMRVLGVSFRACPNLPIDQKLRVYGSGSCNGAIEGSRIRMNTALKFWDQSKPRRTWTADAEIVALFEKPVEEPAVSLGSDALFDDRAKIVTPSKPEASNGMRGAPLLN